MAEMTNLLLLNVPLEMDYQHTLWFTSKANQYNYFYSMKKREYADFSYQRKDGVIRIPDHADNLLAAGCNYVMYKNPSYGDKWFYAFIEEIRYESPGRTDVKIQTDCMQTWMFDIDIRPSFVEREHAASDNIGEHTLDEDLAVGEYVVHKKRNFNIDTQLSIVAAVTRTPSGDKVVGGMYHGIYSGVAYYPFNRDGTKLEEFIKSYDEDAAAEGITMMFLAPTVMLKNASGEVIQGQQIPHSGNPFKAVVNKPLFDSGTYDQELVVEFADSTIDRYTPRNNKLFCYPYRYLLASNNAGGSAVYKFERFFHDSASGVRTYYEPSFELAGCITPGMSIKLTPLCYNGSEENNEESLNMGKYPVLNWTSDAYTNWLTQNSVNQGLSIAGGAVKVAGGLAAMALTGGAATAVAGGVVASGASSIFNALEQRYQASLVPPQAKGNINSGDITTALGNNDIKFYTMCVKMEYAEIIDNFFDMYGYKCHRVKYPEVNHREAYWYTKTIDINMTGNIPQKDLQTIKDCYNRGITFWRSPLTFRNYKAANGCIAVG